jgi:hypothetical protein
MAGDNLEKDILDWARPEASRQTGGLSYLAGLGRRRAQRPEVYLTWMVDRVWRVEEGCCGVYAGVSELVK